MLLETFETMRQCEPEGFIASTLKVAAGTKEEKAYEARINALHNRISTEVIAILLHQRIGKLSNQQRTLLMLGEEGG